VIGLPLLGPGDGSRLGRRIDRLRTSLRRSGVLRATTVKVAIFAAVCLVVLGVLAARIGNVSFFANRVQYHADLSDATGLQPAANVKIAGVTVGQVDAVREQHGHAVVTFSVNKGVHLPRDTQVGMQWQNVLGNQYLYLYPGHARADLRPGGTLSLADDVSSPDIGKLLNALGPLLGAIHPQQANAVVEAFASALSGNESQINQLIDSAASVSHTVGSVDVQVGQVIDSLDQVFGALAQRSSDVGTLIGNLQTISQSLASNNGLLDSTIGNLSKVAADVATLVQQTHGSLTTAIDGLDVASATIQQNDASLATGLSGLGSGLAPYTDISSSGQYFNVLSVYTCLANQQVCSYYDSSSPPPGSGPLGSPPIPGLPSPPSLPGSSGASDATAGPTSGAAALAQLFAPLAAGGASGLGATSGGAGS
jgi:phospholipid/cholesterol/gamma-HCH transport system substrate-binding protein